MSMPTNLLIEIQQRLPVHLAKQVLVSLRQDELVWSELQREDLFKSLPIYQDQNIIVWSPGAFALQVLGFPMSLDELADPSYVPLEKHWCERCLSTYERTLRAIVPPASLGEAGLLALALRERRRLIRSWAGLAQELSKNLSGDPLPISIWKPVLSCLYRYVSDPLDIFKSLLAEWKGLDVYALVSHALLSNPMTYEEKVRIFRKLLEELSEGQQLEWLRYLRLRNQAELVQDLAGSLLLLTRQETTEQDEEIQNELLPEDVVSRLSKERRFYYLYRLSGQPALAISALQRIQTILQSWHHGLQVALASCATMSGDEEVRQASLSLISSSIESLKNVQSELVFLVEDDDTFSLVSEFAGDGVSPVLKLKRAEWLAKNGDGIIAAQLAKAAAQEFRDQLNRAEHLSEEIFAFDCRPDLIVELLLKLELNLEALETAQVILKHRPDDVKIVGLIAQILENLDDLEGAKQHLTLAIVLEPDNPVWFRRRASVLERQKNWQQAMQDYRAVLELVVHPEADDYLAFARSSASCNQHGLAVEACRRVLEKYPDHDEACYQLGLSLLALEQPDVAISYLTHAITVSPKNVKVWLALVESYHKTNQHQRALETLRSSVIANPDSLELSFALGVACLQCGLLSEALPYLQKADANGTFSSRASLYYGKALCALKRYDEAREVLDRAIRVWPQDVELNFCLGELLVQLGKEEEAIHILETAILPSNIPCEWLILYVRAILGKDSILFSDKTFDFYRLTNALHTLERIIVLDPNHLEARLWLAEVLAYQENYQSAFEIYTRLAEMVETVTPDWHWRVQSGLGLCALHLGHFDVAIAALQEAIKDHSDQAALHRLLAKAYLSANLVREALQTAREALSLAPNNLETLAWFADFAMLVEAEDEAINALKCATQLAPQDSAYWVRLAELQYQVGDLENAQKSLQTFQELPDVSKEVLRTAAGLYLKLDQPQTSLACIERAISMETQYDPVLGFERAYLFAILGNFSRALEELGYVEEAVPNDPSVLVFEADLMMALERHQAAQACLNRALPCFDDPKWNNHSLASDMFGKDTELVTSWLPTLMNKVMARIRLAGLERQMGNLPQALAQIQMALEENGENLFLRFWAADLCAAMLQFDKALQYVEGAPENNENKTPVTLLFDPQNQLETAVQCLKAELSLFAGEAIDVAYWIQELLEKAPDHPWVCLIQARLLARQGNWKEAQERFWHAFAFKKSEDVSAQENSPFNFWNRYGLSTRGYLINPAWWIETALETRNWQDALQLGLELLGKEPLEPLFQLVAVKSIAKCVEQQILCEELGCIVNAPQHPMLSRDVLVRVNEVLSHLQETSDSLEVIRWGAYVRLVLQPSAQHIREMTSLPAELQSEETLCLILRKLKNRNAATQILQQSPQKPAVFMQLALSFLGIDDEKAFSYARRSVELMPTDPLAHIVLAKTAEKFDVTLAYESIRNALATWFDEPEWHVMAARYAKLLGRETECMDHWEQAYAIKPDKFEYVFGLGEECLRQKLEVKAIELLSKACLLKPESGQAWLMLAKAYQQNGVSSKAIECALKAEKLLLDSAEPLLICSEAARTLGNMAMADQYIRKALTIAPQNAEVVLSYVDVLIAQGQHKEALSALESYLPGLENNIRARQKFAELLWKVKGTDVALPYLKELVESAPNESGSLALYAKMLNEKGDQDGAVIAAQKALKLLPTQAELHLLLGKIYGQRGQLDQALHHLSEAVRQAPGDVEAYLELGGVYRERREYLNALYVYQQAISLFPSDFRAYVHAASVLRETKDYAGAEAMLRKASQLAPDDLNVHRQLSAIIALNLIHHAQEVNVTS